jgi:hypothetical protein
MGTNQENKVNYFILRKKKKQKKQKKAAATSVSLGTTLIPNSASQSAI